MPRLTVLLALSLFLFSALLLACGGSSAPADPTAPAATATPTPVPTPTPAPLSVSAKELRLAYEGNKVAADAKYKDQWVLVSGTISSIAEAGGGYDVKLETDEFLSLTAIVCKVAADEVDTVLALNTGQYIAIRGILEGKGFSDIVVQNCTVQDAPQSAAPSPDEPAAARAETQTQPTAPAPTAPAAVPETPAEPVAPAAAEPTASPEPTPAPEPTATPEPTPTPTPLPPGSAVDNPAAAGSVLNGVDGTEVVVTGIVNDAWELIQAENLLNDPPSSGNRFFMITVGVAYPTDSASVEISDTDFGLIGDNRVVYDPFASSCGSFPVLPNKIEGELYPGGKIEGNICFAVPADEENFILIYQPELGATRTYLRVDPEQLSSLADLTATVPAPNPDALAMPAGMTLENPVPVGGALSGVDGTETRATDIVPDAWPLLQAENPFNDPPDAGNIFYMVAVEFSYLSGNETLAASNLNFSLIGDSRVVYDPWDDSCGSFPVIPNALEGELFPGGKTQGNICFEAPQSETGFILIYQSNVLEVASRRFLRLE